MIEAYPLQWPAGFPRAKERYSSNFKITADKARKHLLDEIELLSDDINPIISSNVPLRKDRHFFAEVAAHEIDDPGVAIYFNYNGQQVVLACDEWVTPADNVRALGLTVQALRGIERWGASQILNRTFAGFKALPETTETEKNIWDILELRVKPDNVEWVKAAFRELSKKRHPDVPGGSHEAFTELQDAYQRALKFYQTT